ncbi:HAD family hydrolase [Enterovibrio coralii]|uniref:hypothetical protein n=1 Tax=Enterovibrio coralii TaxID=294935 RepID=UPI0012FAA264|nr:hypothetical protein [Enterovibrio coralii]
MQKNDPAYKEFERLSWHPVLSLKTTSGELYYCLTKEKTTLSELQKTQLLAPICIVDGDYSDMLIFLEEEGKAFYWRDKVCFFMEDCASSVLQSKIGQSIQNKVLTNEAMLEIVNSANITAKTHFGNEIYIIGTLVVFILFALGAYWWLF